MEHTITIKWDTETCELRILTTDDLVTSLGMLEFAVVTYKKKLAYADFVAQTMSELRERYP
jgi:hypothetical protein